jgi:Cd2+/Zn2+-exporting ATPase
MERAVSKPDNGEVKLVDNKIKPMQNNIKSIIKKEFVLEGLCCGNCAAKIEREVNNIDGVKSAVVDFVGTKLFMEIDNLAKQNTVIEKVNEIVGRIEPDVKVIELDKGKEISKDDADENENKHDHSVSNKADIIRFVVGAAIFGTATAMKFSHTVELILYLISYVLVGGEVVLRAVKNISRGQVFDENFLMGIATIGAFAIGDYPEGVAVMLFYQLGEIFQDMAVNRSRKSITALMDIRPDFANL